MPLMKWTNKYIFLFVLFIIYFARSLLDQYPTCVTLFVVIIKNKSKILLIVNIKSSSEGISLYLCFACCAKFASLA